MPTFCVSDLHLGDRGPRDNFAHGGREARFRAFLAHVAAANGRIYILGDLFDWWQTSLSRSVVAYRDLLEQLDDLETVWIAGNHDSALTHFIGSPWMPSHPLFRRCRLAHEESFGSRRCALLHGHEADPYCRSENPGTGELTAIISGLLEDRNGAFGAQGDAIEDAFVGGLEQALTLYRRLTGQQDRLRELLAGVEAYRRDRQADVVVSGHTHAPGRIGDWHYNCGCWCRRRDTFVRIEDDGEAGVFEWTSAGPSPVDDLLELAPTGSTSV